MKHGSHNANGSQVHPCRHQQGARDAHSSPCRRHSTQPVWRRGMVHILRAARSVFTARSQQVYSLQSLLPRQICSSINRFRCVRQIAWNKTWPPQHNGGVTFAQVFALDANSNARTKVAWQSMQPCSPSMRIVCSAAMHQARAPTPQRSRQESNLQPTD